VQEVGGLFNWGAKTEFKRVLAVLENVLGSIGRNPQGKRSLRHITL